MTIESLSALAGLAVSMTWTPGPNNMMLAASGANFGWRRTTAHALGVSIGFPVMLFVVAIGLGRLFAAEPMIAETLSWIGFAIVLWFAWKIATAVQARAAGRAPRPLSFLQACAFQWVNPKAWTFAIWVTASYATGATSALTAALVFLISGLASSFAWSVFGAGIGATLDDDRRLRAFNIAMAALLIGSAVWLMLGR